MISQSVFLPNRVTLVGILNVTPDSFSDGGRLLAADGRVDTERLLEQAEHLVSQGADVLDVGGESTRPGAQPVSREVEVERTQRVIERLCGSFEAPVSIDTRNAVVAEAALKAGARIVNDVTGLQHDPAIAERVADFDAILVLGHVRGTPLDMQRAPAYEDVLSEVADELEQSVARARAAGVSDRQIVLDPGIGFGKRLEDNLALMAHVGWLRDRMGLPLMLGPSRKSFIESITGDPLHDRDDATAAVCAVAAFEGVDAVRVHDVRRARRAVLIGGALRAARRKSVE